MRTILCTRASIIEKGAWRAYVKICGRIVIIVAAATLIGRIAAAVGLRNIWDLNISEGTNRERPRKTVLSRRSDSSRRKQWYLSRAMS
jgi:hypothetical protein